MKKTKHGAVKLLAFLLFLSNSLFCQVNLSSGLMAYYPFNGNANDVSGNNNNPNFNNATLTADRFGTANSAYHFNGIDNYIQIPNSPTLNTNNTISICAWVKVTGFYHGLCHGNRFVMKGIVDNPYTGNYLLGFDDGYYTNGTNCNGSPADTIHSNFYGLGTTAPGPDYITKNKWYSVIYTYDGAVARLYINCSLMATTSFPQTFTNPYDLCFGKLNNVQYPYWLNGDLDEVRIYNRAITRDEVTVISGGSVSDFSFQQSICKPKSVQFNTTLPNTSSFAWDFGNSTTNTTTQSPTVVYNAYNNYKVKLAIAHSGGCMDTVTKIIPINALQDNSLISTKDTTLCVGGSAQLNATNGGVGYCWNPTTGLSNANILNPVATPTTTTTYYYTTQTLGNNLVMNGDFENGNIGFASDYVYQTPPRTSQSQYYVGNNPNAWFNPFIACGDHTTGSGNMMMFDGSATANTTLWKEQVLIQPNTNYIFSGWVQSIVSQNPAQLVFKINGNPIGATLTAINTACNWSQFMVTWNSGSNTIADLSIIDNNLIVQGNDFAIDDIVFSTVQTRTDSVNIVVNPCTVIIPGFTAPDTVCVNAPVNIVNTTTGATTYNWNFCNETNLSNLTGTNLGNINNQFSLPVFCDYALYSGNYYAFVANHVTGNLIRLNFGNSLLNTPTAFNLGNFSGTLQQTPMGIQLVEDGGLWYAVVVDGDPTLPASTSKIVVISFGANLANNAPTIQDYGNIGGMNYPADLYVFKDNNNWYGLTINGLGNNFTLFSFGTSVSNTPTATNLGNLGCSLNVPSGFHPIKDNGKWYLFVTSQNNNKIFRIDFGTSLLNAPLNTVDLGSLSLNKPTDITFVKSCQGYIGYVFNFNPTNIIKLDFSSLTSIPIATNIGNAGNLNGARSFGKLFNVNNDLYSLIPNYSNSTVSRIQFTNTCTNSSVPSSTLQTPPVITYNTAGTYNINLTVDDGLPTQASVCKQVVVVALPVLNITANKTICSGDSVILSASGASSYQWSPATGLSNTTIANPVAKPTITTTYNITGYNSANCSATGSVKITVLLPPTSIKDTITGCYSVTYNGNTYNSNTIVKDTLKYVQGCDSIIRQHQIIVNTYKRDTIYNTICIPQTYLGYSTTGIYNDTFHITGACDSIRTLYLTVNNCTISSCRGAVELHGGDKVSLPGPEKKYYSSNGFTWETWFNSSYYANSNTTTDTRNKLMSSLDVVLCEDILIGFGWVVGAPKNAICFVVDGPSGCSNRNSTPCFYKPAAGFIPDTWYHVAGVRDYVNNKSLLYLNGQLVDTKTNTQAPITRNLSTFLGNFIPFVDSGFAGKMDEIRYWDYPRNAAEIQSNYDKCLAGNESGLVAYYRSNESTGKILHDATANGNDATLSSSVAWNRTVNAPLSNPCFLSSASSLDTTVCSGQTVRGHNVSGTYKDTLLNSIGCDSVRTLKLIVLSAPATIVNAGIKGCNSVTYNGNVYNSSTTVTDTIKNILGCDSVYKKQPIVILPNAITKKDTIGGCGQVIYKGITYLSNSTLIDTLKYVLGCDSIYNNHSIIVYPNTPIIATVPISGCGSVLYNSVVYSNNKTFIDTVKSTHGCDSVINTVNIIINPKPTIKVPKDTTICLGTSATLAASSNGTVQWIGSSSNPLIVAPLLDSICKAVASNAFGCTDTASVHVFVQDFKLSLAADINPATKGFPVVLSTSSITPYTINSWWTNPAILFSNNTALTQSFVADTNHLIKVFAVSNIGCKDTTQLQLIVVPFKPSTLFIPNVFSPNHDGLNDTWIIPGIENFAHARIFVFDRGGQEVFRGNGLRPFDGNYNGKPVPVGTYYYIIQLNDSRYPNPFSGWLEVLR